MDIVENISNKKISRWEYISPTEESFSVNDITENYREVEKKGWKKEVKGNLVKELLEILIKLVT